MNKLTSLLWRGYEFLIAGCAAMQSPFLLVLRLYFFWQLFLTGKGKLANIGKVAEFFTSLGIPLPTLNAYFNRFARMFRQLALDHRSGITTSGAFDRTINDSCLPHGRFRGRIQYFQRS